MSALPVLPVAGPLAIAGIMLVLGHVLPRRVPDVVATLTALATSGICAFMAMHAGENPLVTWFGGWTPRPGLTIGIGFTVDQAGAAMGAFIGFLFAASLVFAWGYFDEVHAHFQVLMLLFMAGMTGFCFTHDLFNLFVWFEVMSVAGFALTGYRLRSSALEGALNFTVVNTLGAYLMLGGIGLIYARTGALDFTALAEGVAKAGPDPVIAASFALFASGLLIKAAQVPFQFWLSDAHAVAPSPVSVIFSGAMVSMGLFGLGRLIFGPYAEAASVQHLVHTLLLGMGVASCVVGGVMALLQRHLKRLLAFSTISHAGIMLIGLALLRPDGLAGMLAYMIGHGLTKGALFTVAGILLATCGGIDEIGLRGLGRQVWPAGIAMALGGLLLAGLPVGLMDQGSARIGAAASAAQLAWLHGAILVGASFTGAAVLRACGRIFGGWGEVPGEEESAPTEEEQENANRPLWLMLAPAGLMLVLAVTAPVFAGDFFGTAAVQMMHSQAAAPGAAQATMLPWISMALAVALAAFGLSRRRLAGWVVRGTDRIAGPVVSFLQALHSGLIGDYVAWAVVGVAAFALSAAF